MPLPSDIANLALWFRAYDLVNLADGTAINGNWSSVIGSCTGSQATGANQPTKQTVNGKTCVRFDGSNDRLDLDGDGLTVSQNVSGLSLFVRCQLNDNTGTDAPLAFSVGTSANLRACVRRTSGLWQSGGRRLDADGFGLAGTMPADTSMRTVAGIFDYANSDLFTYVDGYPAGSNLAFSTAGSTSNTASQTARIGCQSDDVNFAAMDLYEVIVYSRALNTTERQTVEAYLAPPSAWRAEARCNIRVI